MGSKYSFAKVKRRIDEMLTRVCSVTYTASGASGLSFECYNIFGGESCETVKQVNVPVAFLQQT